MPLNFPTNPAVNQTYSFGSSTYKWDGGKWISVVTEPSRLVSGSNSLEINGNNLVWVGGDVNLDGGTFFLDESTNRVGIGTITPGVTLDVVGTIRATNITGTLVVPLGAFGTPSLTFTGDLNTGIFSPGENQLAISANGAEVARIDSSSNLLVTGGFLPTNTSRLVVRGFSSGTYNNTFSQTNATAQIISNEMSAAGWHPTFNIAMVRQSLTTGGNAFGGIGFSTIDDSNSSGMFDAGRIAIVNENGAAVASGTAMAFYTQVGSATNTNNATERLRITSTGTVNIVGAGTVGSTQAISFSGTAPVDSLVVNSTGAVGCGASAFIRSPRLGVVGTNNLSSDQIVIAATNPGIVINCSEGGTANRGAAIVFDHGDLVAAISSSRVDTNTWETDLRFYTHPSAYTLQYTLPEKMRITGSGNVGIGTTNPQYKLEVNGSFAATTKSFIIPHPTKQNYKLQHGSLEGPENGVYVRGRSGLGVIELPEYWTKLIDPSSITVTLTPIGQNASLWVERIEDNKIYIGREDSSVAYFYMVNAERIDVEPLKVEIPNPS